MKGHIHSYENHKFVFQNMRINRDLPNKIGEKKMKIGRDKVALIYLYGKFKRTHKLLRV